MVAEMKIVRPLADIRQDFPALSQTVNGRRICYLDSASSAQKPQAVIDAMAAVMTDHYANVHRGVYTFSAKTSLAFESARKKVAGFIGAASEKEIVFTRNATEAINLVATTLGETLEAGDEIILSELEHHANIVPWYFLKEKKGVVLKIVPILADGTLDLDAFQKLLSSKTKILTVTQMSNVLGTVVPVAEMIRAAKAVGAKTLVDGSQSAAHLDINVRELGCDFFVFTGHKLYGPTGVGVLYGLRAALAALPPYQGGGEMIESVSFDKVTFKEPPYRFEAGTPAIVEAIGLGAAIDYLLTQDVKALRAHEHLLLAQAKENLKKIEGVRLFEGGKGQAAVLSFNVGNVHPHDVATVFDQMGVAVRAGHHCAQPLMKSLGIAATVRASFSFYNTLEDVERLVEAVQKTRKIFA